MKRGSSSSSSTAGGSDSLTGLKFDKKIYFELVSSGFQPKISGGPSSATAPPSSLAKKGRTGVFQGGQPPRCQVEGCKVDLSDAKAYYSRHKVCSMHSKFPKVIVAGLEQRFCQQCSRFHQLPEFDKGKRSCRRRLAGHNERRRKPPAGSLLAPRCGSFSQSIFDNHTKTGGFMRDFNTCPTLFGRDTWTNLKFERGLGNEVAITGTCPTLFGRDTWTSLKFERGLGNEVAITGLYQPPWQSNSHNPSPDSLQGLTTQPSYSGSLVSFEECFSGVSDSSSSALSLLSHHPWGSRSGSSSIGVNSFLGTKETTILQPSINPGTAIGQFFFP